MNASAMHALAQFHFLRPLALLLLLALPLFWLAWRNGRSDAGAWRGAVDAHLLPHLMERIDGGPGRAGLALAALLWVLACLALAGPAWEREPMPLYRNQAARVLALQLSATMLAQDEKPSRLARARFKLDDILARSRDYQTALIGYAGDAFVAAPLTDDVGTVHNLIDSLDPGTMPVGGNATSRAIEAGVDLIEQAGLHRGEIILLADSAGASATDAAHKAKASGITVSVLGIGSAAGAPVPLAQGDFMKDGNGGIAVAKLDEHGLRAVAEAGGGRYATLTPDASDLDALLGNRVEGVDRGSDDAASPAQTAETARWRDRGPWVLLLLAPLALCGFRRGWLMAVALALMTPVRHAQATSFADLWQRSDQQAAHALAEGNAKQAANVARTPDWRGGASYKAGDFGAAADAYTHVDGADGAYNKGNALAKLGRYEDAIAAYDAALKIAPEMQDAQANRKAVEDFLKKSRQDKSKQGSKDQPKDGQDSQKQDGEKKPQDQKGGEKDQQKSQQSGQEDKDKQQDPSSGKGEKDDKNASDKDAQNSQDKKPPSSHGDDAKDQAAGTPEGADKRQKEALSKDIDKALADTAKPADKDAKPQPGITREDEATRQKKQALEHWLQRVPDDPGGLLRRKFQLEYQRRQQRGGEGE